MKKRILVLILSILVLLITSGCGDKFKGIWATTDKSTWDGSNMIRILKIDVADNGDYLIKDGNRYYNHDSAPMDTIRATASLSVHDEIMNVDETLQRHRYGYNWNGTEVKICEKYTWRESDSKNTLKIPKDKLTTKDGLLVVFGKTYKKVDEAQFNKMKEDWKNSLKARVGLKGQRYIFDCGDVQVRVAKVIIIENGKEEIFEEGKDMVAMQTNKPAVTSKANSSQSAKSKNGDFTIPKDEKAPWKENETKADNGILGVITGTEVRMRQAASTDAKILGYFNKGETVTILESQNGWHKVRRSNGAEGYVSADFCKAK